MDAKKFNLEYSMRKTPVATLWNMISLPNGLSEWIAESVDNDGELYTFRWKSHSQQARLLDSETESYIRFHWIDEEPGTFFEMRIIVTELTNEVTLLVTDFAEPGDQAAIETLWNQEVDVLRRRMGV